MKLISFCLFFIMMMQTSFAQKPTIDSNVYDAWPILRSMILADNGKFVAYNIMQADFRENNTLVLQATKEDWKTDIPVKGYSFATFVCDSKKIVFFKSKDSIGIATPGTNTIDYIAGIRSFKVPKKEKKVFLGCLMNAPDNKLIVLNLETNQESSFPFVKNYLFNGDGTLLLLHCEIKEDSVMKQVLRLVDLPTGKATDIWEGSDARYIVFDTAGRQLAFWQNDNKLGTMLWYYKAGTEQAVQIANEQITGIDPNIRLTSDYLKFKNDGSGLFVHLKERENIRSKQELVKVNVWSYNDATLQSQQLTDLAPRSFLGIIPIQGNRLIRLEQENERNLFLLADEGNDNYLILMKQQGDFFLREKNWNPASRPSLYLISTNNGSKKQLTKSEQIVNYIRISPNGKYLIYYIPKEKNYFSYDITSGIIRNITRQIASIWTTYEENDMGDSLYKQIGLAGWSKYNDGVFIYDQNDIWLVDPGAVHQPINITNGFGQKHNIRFQFLESLEKSILNNNDTIVLLAFNRDNKNCGFYRIKMGLQRDPVQLSMGQYSYDFKQNQLVKARNANVYVLNKMSATEYPNYHSTSDFKTFTPISNLHPEKAYNWVTTELIRWPTLDGRYSRGILYKPENFDPNKKYPLLLYYYERFSDNLNVYLQPEPSSGPINIPYFVSNGYIVFTPDIHYKIGHPLENAYNTVVSAASYLSRYPWIDPKKIGIQGHSWGGYETNYIVTHTNIFAAAMSAAGVSDMISSYGSISHGGMSRQHYYELNQIRIGATLWEKPDLYIKNSPVLKANKITTPLLLMHNKEDGSVPFTQSIEFFTALRRLGKKVWLLQYDGEGHILGKPAAKDYSIRIMQFFNHYLKNEPAPVWMTTGIPARLKGIESGLQMENTLKSKKNER